VFPGNARVSGRGEEGEEGPQRTLLQPSGDRTRGRSVAPVWGSDVSCASGNLGTRQEKSKSLKPKEPVNVRQNPADRTDLP